MTPDDFKKYIKELMQKILPKVKADRAEAFKTGAKAAATWVLNEFKEITFYTPKSYSQEGQLIMSYFKEGAECPTFVYWMDGLRAEKY